MDNLKKILLENIKYYEICYKGMLFSININERLSTIDLKTLVFSEKSYITISIKSCVNKVFESSKRNQFPSFLRIDEENFSVEFIQRIPVSANISIHKLIKLFVFASRSWATILKNIAKKDLKH